MGLTCAAEGAWEVCMTPVDIAVIDDVYHSKEPKRSICDIPPSTNRRRASASFAPRHATSSQGGEGCADGYHPLALLALFGGDVKESEYFLVNEFVGQGVTLANLRGFVESRGAKLLGGASLS